MNENAPLPKDDANQSSSTEHIDPVAAHNISRRAALGIGSIPAFIVLFLLIKYEYWATIIIFFVFLIFGLVSEALFYKQGMAKRTVGAIFASIIGAIASILFMLSIMGQLMV